MADIYVGCDQTVEVRVRDAHSPRRAMVGAAVTGELLNAAGKAVVEELEFPESETTPGTYIGSIPEDAPLKVDVIYTLALEIVATVDGTEFTLRPRIALRAKYLAPGA